MHPKSLTIAESLLHVAGVEVSFASQLTGTELNGHLLRLKKAAIDGVVNQEPFPYTQEELTADLIFSLLKAAEEMVRPVIENPSQELLDAQIVSALGPVIEGRGALARLSMHPAYHQGQAYLIKESPNFPAV
jgi:hypothetical protein